MIRFSPVTDELSQSAPVYKHASLDRPVGCLKYYYRIKRERALAVFENNSKALWGCADRTTSSNAHGANTSLVLVGKAICLLTRYQFNDSQSLTSTGKAVSNRPRQIFWRKVLKLTFMTDHVIADDFVYSFWCPTINKFWLDILAWSLGLDEYGWLVSYLIPWAQTNTNDYIGTSTQCDV